MERITPYELIIIASILWLGYVGSKVFQRLKLPSVTGFLLVGIVLGPQALNLLNNNILHRLSFIEPLALGVITFIIGEKLFFKKLADLGLRSLLISLTEIIMTSILTYWIVFTVTGQPAFSLFLAIMAITTAPATIVSLISETRSKGKFTEIIATSVALNNMVAVVLFSIVLPIVISISANGLFTRFALTKATSNILLSLLIGMATSLALTYLVPRLDSEGELSVFVLAHVGLAVAVSLLVDVSPILATLIAGSLTVNIFADRKQNRRVYDSLKMIAEPIYLVFFVLAGASLKFDFFALPGTSQSSESLLTSGFAILIAYIFARSLGKVVGPLLGSIFSGFSLEKSKNISTAFLSQSAIAIGLSLIVLDKYPAIGEKLNAVILGAVVFFEAIGPPLIKRSLVRLGEAGKDIIEDTEHLEGLIKKDFVKIMIPIGTKVLSAKNARIITQLSRRINAEIIAIHVRSIHTSRGLEAAKTRSENFIHDFEKIMEKEKVPYRVMVKDSDNVVKTICLLSQKEQVDMVIMGASGRSNIVSRLFGGITDKVTRKCNVPVLLLHD